ncbi:uncharacterized protein [Physcomitrium patens]|uniref:C2H2-type domain-containing protein n=2 Tax=Physcomitrium patens TaxID=3218 RepID=A9S6D3_PHYPA|nr:zinc finger protein JAGGED-like [Physcomitrium patens]PNR46247.1 hypothetical protein PHYPA_013366 [Physcomitrium patens]|eukprot:XP_024386618.1 zinc finger protein JAGGED-like [Physcomitrella patens]
MVWCGGGAALAIAGLASSETMEMAMAMLRSGGGGGSLEAPQQQQDEPFKCKFCGRSFRKHQALGGHMNAHQEARDREKLEKLHDRLCRPRINGAPLKPLYPEVNDNHYGPANEMPPYQMPAQISIGYPPDPPMRASHNREGPMFPTYANAYPTAVPYGVPYQAATPLLDNSMRNPPALSPQGPRHPLEPVRSQHRASASSPFEAESDFQFGRFFSQED